jgi:hypothetical protein
LERAWGQDGAGKNGRGEKGRRILEKEKSFALNKM